ncbi:unnamed protein product [[Candida] boidinii]|nr:unnamed protein product [[Candida] boidinii]
MGVAVVVVAVVAAAVAVAGDQRMGTVLTYYSMKADVIPFFVIVDVVAFDQHFDVAVAAVVVMEEWKVVRNLKLNRLVSYTYY